MRAYGLKGERGFFPYVVAGFHRVSVGKSSMMIAVGPGRVEDAAGESL
jgi:hypothetical protein